ncbi:MAG: NTF2-like N-terminal transpeptidase domain-containing protein [Bergeyella zoohelcum]|nr:NTF2-like N-terminal transpeptidase domain-containing protein [Bergeyella zoohelcum]
MKRFYLLFILFIALVSCKKDTVDATNTKTFQASINDMTSQLPTLEQVKFNEALYVLKTFGVDGETDVQRIASLGKLINGMKVPQILALADKVAQENGIEWTSVGPPSLGEMNIFGSEEATEFDPNDIKAASLRLTTIEMQKDSILGAKVIQVVPRLVDSKGGNIAFSGAALETILEVFSNGTKIWTAKNLMQDNDFKGFAIKLANIPAERVVDGLIDISVSVKTTNKTHKMSKIGVAVSPLVLKQSIEVPQENLDMEEGENPDETDTETKPTSDPKSTVNRFLNQLNAQNFKGAYEVSYNPNWSSYEAFSNANTGFGSVKNISVKTIYTASSSANSASVNATYEVTDNSGKTTALNVTFGLKNINGDWKISTYRIN